jgi:hypothetical protein
VFCGPETESDLDIIDGEFDEVVADNLDAVSLRKTLEVEEKIYPPNSKFPYGWDCSYTG